MTRIFHKDFDFGGIEEGTAFAPRFHIGMELPTGEHITYTNFIIEDRKTGEVQTYVLSRSK